MMLQKLLMIFVILSLSNTVLADDSVYLDKDKPAPYSGYLLPEAKVKELRNSSLERDMYKTTNELKDQQIKLLSDQNNKLATTLESTSNLSTWEKIGCFAGGVLLTGLAIAGAHAIYK